MADRNDIVRLAAELAAKAAALGERAGTGTDDDAETAELRAELDRLEKELEALEAEEESLDLGFDPDDVPLGADFSDEDSDTDPDQPRSGSDDDASDVRFSDLGAEISDLVERALDTLSTRFAGLGSTLGANLSLSRVSDVVERSVAVPGPIAVHIRSRAGAITVRPSTGDEVRVVAERHAPTEDQLDEIQVSAVSTSDGVAVVADWSRGRRRWVHLTVEVPVGSSVSATTAGGAVRLLDTHGSATIRTRGGSIRSTGTAGEVDVDTAGGSIRVLDHQGRVRARTSGGSVRIAGRLVGEVDAKTSGGSIRVVDVDGATVRVSTSGGSIRVEGRVVGESSVHTSGGSVTLTIPADSRLHVEGSGSTARSDFPDLACRAGKIEGTLGDGSDGSVRLATSGGSVTVRRG